MTINRKEMLDRLAEIMDAAFGGVNTIVPEEAFAHMNDEEFTECINVMIEDFERGEFGFDAPLDLAALKEQEPEVFEQLKAAAAAQGMDIEAELAAMLMDRQGNAPTSNSLQ